MKNQNNSSAAFGLKNGSRKLLLMPLLFVAGLLFSQEAISQQKPAATLTNNGVLQLPANLPLAPAYVISLSSFGFTSEAQAVQYFSSKSYDSFFIRPNVAQNKAVIQLSIEKHPGWTVSNWNNLLNSQTTTTPLLN